MWEIRDKTPFRSIGTITIDKHGEKSWTVVTKGTFDILPGGGTKLADQQIEPLFTPEYYGAPGASSLRYEQELIPEKPRTDIYLNATAYAARGQKTTKERVSIQTSRWLKSLAVYGDRYWEKNSMGMISASSPSSFLTMPIQYERAYGGYDQQDPDPSKHRLDPFNPVGVGFFTKRAHGDGRRLPNIEHVKQTRHPMWAAGFGALCSYWKPRVDFQGSYDKKWLEMKKPLLPDDFDPLNYQCAPPDQQSNPYLRGGEPFRLTNLTPNGTLEFVLPTHYLAFKTFIGSKQVEHRASINTVIIEPDYLRLMIVWNTTLKCHHDIDNIDYTQVIEKNHLHL